MILLEEWGGTIMEMSVNIEFKTTVKQQSL